MRRGRSRAEKRPPAPRFPPGHSHPNTEAGWPRRTGARRRVRVRPIPCPERIRTSENDESLSTCMERDPRNAIHRRHINRPNSTYLSLVPPRASPPSRPISDMCSRSLLTSWPPFLPILGHVLAIPAHGLAALAPGLARLLRVELVRGTLLVRGLAALAGDLALLLVIHRCESTVLIGICHSHSSFACESRR